MLRSVELRNYRGFSRHTVPLRDTTIIVGGNNAGKSTLIEALKVISIVASRAQFLNYRYSPDWLDVPPSVVGVYPSLSGIGFEFENLGHQYSDEPANIQAVFDNGNSISIYLSPEHAQAFALLRTKDKQIVSSKSEAYDFFTIPINVCPPAGRLNPEERYLQDDTVRKNLNNNISCLHFRNQIYRYGDTEAAAPPEDDEFDQRPATNTFEVFCKLAEFTWPKLKIEAIERSGSSMSLLVRDGSFVTEVGKVGSGLQAWLQTCWFLARTPQDSVVVFDEPDIFLHADLERKLFRLISGYFTQAIVATHSTEILAEVEAEDVLVVDKNARSSKFTENIPAVQNVINNIGGAHNLQLTRLWSARRCIFVEGDDLEFLQVFQNAFDPTASLSISSIPHIPIGGFGNWKHAVGAAIGFRNASNKEIRSFCILDSDYRTQEEHNKIEKEASDNGLALHIWSKKEIENYVINEDVISRFIQSRNNKNVPTAQTVRNRIDKICDGLEELIFDQIANNISLRDRNGVADANKKARAFVKARWGTLEGKLALAPGKTVVSQLSAWAQTNYKVSFSALSLAREMDSSELDTEVISVLNSVIT